MVRIRVRPCLSVVLVSLFCSPLGAGAAERVVTLTLEGGADKARDLTIDLTERGDGFAPDVWATAYRYNCAQHRGTAQVSKREGAATSLAVRLAIEGDVMGPGGTATYDITLTRGAAGLEGAYTGTFVDMPVTGLVHGVASEMPDVGTPDFKPLRPNEHPRLIFRPADLPELRRRMQTPEGQAMLEMLTRRSPIRHAEQATDRRSSWIAANWGAVWQLTGDTNAANEARAVLMKEVIVKPFPPDRTDIQHAARLLGVALAYDLCADAWDEAFRGLMAEFLLVSAGELARGEYQGFALTRDLIDPVHWKHRNAARMSSAGCAAIAVLGDTGADGKPLEGAAELVRKAERHVTVYLRDGITQSGYAPEGTFERDFALANGVLQFLNASRVALGRDLSGVNPGALAGNILSAPLDGNGRAEFGISSISLQVSGRWPMGLGAVPAPYLPAMKWCFDRDVGLEGAQHFDCAFPFQAAYALRNYPFGAKAEPPGAGFPLMTRGTAQGHFVFRNRWRDANDAVVEVFLNLLSIPSPRQRGAGLTPGVLNVSGLGSAWIRGFVGPSPLNDRLGARLLYADVGAGQAAVGMDLSASFVKVEREQDGEWRQRRAELKGRELPRMSATSPGLLPQPEEIRAFLKQKVPRKTPAETKPSAAPDETGPKLTRHLATDYSGLCGAPVLLAIVDRAAGFGRTRWQLPLVAPASPAEPGSFVCGDPAGANLRGWFVAPGDARLSGRGIEFTDVCFVVLTLQEGASPAVSVSGAGLDAVVTAGHRTIRFDGEKVVLGEK